MLAGIFDRTAPPLTPKLYYRTTAPVRSVKKIEANLASANCRWDQISMSGEARPLHPNSIKRHLNDTKHRHTSDWIISVSLAVRDSALMASSRFNAALLWGCFS